MQDKVIVVSAPDRSVSVDGVRFKCITTPPPGLRVMRWDASVADWPGWIETQTEGHGFKDFARIEPFVKLWEAAKAADDESQAAAAAHRQAAETRRKAEEDAERAKFEAATAEQARALEAQKPLSEALKALADSDHEIVKVMEEQLFSAGMLDTDLVAKRKAWREKVKAERAKV